MKGKMWRGEGEVAVILRCLLQSNLQISTLLTNWSRFYIIVCYHGYMVT